jgi:peroxiredoxin
MDTAAKAITVLLIMGTMCLSCSGDHSSQKSSELSAMVERSTSMLAELSVRDTAGVAVALSSLYKSKPLVLVVSLGTDCPMCMMSMKQLSQQAARIREYGWNIAALSNDPPEEHHAALYRSSLDSSFVQPGTPFEIPLYSDSNHTVMETLGCYRRSLDTERHGLFLISKQGAILFSAIDRRPFEQYSLLMDTLRALRPSHNNQ